MTARVSFDRVADVYDRTRAMPPDATAAVATGIAAVLRDAAPDPRLLEVGLGTGRIAVPLAEAGIRVVGIDIATAMLAQARRKRADLAVVVADATAPPFRDASFDGALFVHFLHLVPVALALPATRRLVRPGGVLLHGHTDYGQPRRALFTLLRDVTREVGGTLPAADCWPEVDAVFAEAVTAAGATCEERVLARWTERTTGAEFSTPSLVASTRTPGPFPTTRCRRCSSGSLRSSTRFSVGSTRRSRRRRASPSRSRGCPPRRTARSAQGRRYLACRKKTLNRAAFSDTRPPPMCPHRPSHGGFRCRSSA